MVAWRRGPFRGDSVVAPLEAGLEEEDEPEPGPSGRGGMNPQDCPESPEDEEDCNALSSTL